MRSRLLRQQFSVSVGSSSGTVLGSNPKRFALIISSPPNIYTDGSNVTQVANGVNVASGGTKLSYTVPAGQTAILQSATAFSATGATPEVQLQIVRGGNTTIIDDNLIPIIWNAFVQLLAGDVIRWQVITGMAGTGDFSLSLIQSPSASGRVTLGFQGDAILDNGITIHPGNAPTILLGEHIGQSITEPITAIASIAGTILSGLDIMEVDCGCSEMTAMDPRRQR